jgi:hypothetical protein
VLGKQLDLTPQRQRPERDRCLVGCPEYGLGLLAGRAARQEGLGLTEARVSGRERMLQPCPRLDSDPPSFGVGPPLEPELLGS